MDARTMRKKLQKKAAKFFVAAYLIYSVATDTLIWGGAIYYLIFL